MTRSADRRCSERGGTTATNGNGMSNTWRVVLAGLISAIFVGIGAYVTLGQNVAHTTDVQSAVEHGTQISQIQTNIKLEQLTTALVALQRTQDMLRQAIVQNGLQLEKLQTQIAILLARRK